LGFFNLLPIFPLDGFNVVRGLLPGKIGDDFAQMAAWGPAILFGLVGLGMFTGFSPLSYILSPLINGSARFLLGGRFF
ncbi:MAG: site-2 protease family protein, partial [Chloroflexi bacterium]|nr:site-2 protease family protein [Chloroflexota bacterium]